MYIIELLVKKFFERKKLSHAPEEITEEERCNHVFMPIDSTGEILACKNCGILVKKKNLKRYKKQG